MENGLLSGGEAWSWRNEEQNTSAARDFGQLSQDVLSRLPGELRNQIYKLIFDEAFQSEGLDPLLVNRQFYNEACLIAFQKTLFDIAELPLQVCWTTTSGAQMVRTPEALVAKQNLLAGVDETKRKAIKRIQARTRDCKSDLFRTLRFLGLSPDTIVLRWYVLEHELWPLLKLEADNPVGLKVLLLRPYCERDMREFHNKVLDYTRALNFWVDPIHQCGPKLLQDDRGRQYFLLRFAKSDAAEVRVVMENDPAFLLPLTDDKKKLYYKGRWRLEDGL